MERRKAILLLVLTVVLWSTSGLLVKLLGWHPLAISGTRSAIAAVVIWSAIRRPRLTGSVPQIGGALAYLAAQSLFVVSTSLTSAANAIFLQYTAPVYVAIFGAWYLRERAKAVDWWTMGLIFVGMALFFGDDLTTAGYWGNLLAILNGICFAWLILFLRKEKDGSPETTALLGNGLAALVGIPFVATSWQAGTLPSAQGWAILLFLGVFQLGVPYLLYSRAIRGLRAVEAVLIQTLEPILNPLWVLWVIGETPGPWALAGGAVVLGAVTLRGLAAARSGRSRAAEPRAAPIASTVD
ncbi:MAG: EamA family transporter [Chloroflexi bacterium]|nr:MAG: EamA family transporter [Chloroflexota bacterium]